jgi:hypothetical protein
MNDAKSLARWSRNHSSTKPDGRKRAQKAQKTGGIFCDFALFCG